ncbi:hypothetical protein SDC9_93142 [bioreactor metagenome]|uniref:Uncharacterized protein n=1 Tax=bioreactor metagenome TaxID=1076179 RepID=A0A645A091_9ZZZZ
MSLELTVSFLSSCVFFKKARVTFDTVELSASIIAITSRFNIEKLLPACKNILCSFGVTLKAPFGKGALRIP